MILVAIVYRLLIFYQTLFYINLFIFSVSMLNLLTIYFNVFMRKVYLSTLSNLTTLTKFYFYISESFGSIFLSNSYSTFKQNFTLSFKFKSKKRKSSCFTFIARMKRIEQMSIFTNLMDIKELKSFEQQFILNILYPKEYIIKLFALQIRG